MEVLLSLLLFAGIFFLMMRFGCGSHKSHGGHGNHEDDQADRHVDPVCGMEVDMNEGYGKMYEKTLYRFCSRKCLDTFENSPEQYISKTGDQVGGES